MPIGAPRPENRSSWSQPSRSGVEGSSSYGVRWRCSVASFMSPPRCSDRGRRPRGGPWRPGAGCPLGAPGAGAPPRLCSSHAVLRCARAPRAASARLTVAQVGRGPAVEPSVGQCCVRIHMRSFARYCALRGTLCAFRGFGAVACHSGVMAAEPDADDTAEEWEGASAPYEGKSIDAEMHDYDGLDLYGDPDGWAKDEAEYQRYEAGWRKSSATPSDKPDSASGSASERLPVERTSPTAPGATSKQAPSRSTARPSSPTPTREPRRCSQGRRASTSQAVRPRRTEAACRARRTHRRTRPRSRDRTAPAR